MKHTYFLKMYFRLILFYEILFEFEFENYYYFPETNSLLKDFKHAIVCFYAQYD